VVQGAERSSTSVVDAATLGGSAPESQELSSVCGTFTLMDMTIGGVQITFSDVPAEADPGTVAYFTRKYGRPAPRSLASDAAWLATELPTSQVLRQLAAEYLHAEFGGSCGVCATEVDVELRGNHPGAPTLDRINPKAEGGTYVWGSVRILHRSCNSELADGRLPVNPEWARQLLEAQLRAWSGQLTRSDVLRVQMEHAKTTLSDVEAELASGILDAEAVEQRTAWAATYRAKERNWLRVVEAWEADGR
jgi:hypothetical protein